jgi:DNA-binding transcriptional MerR regulator
MARHVARSGDREHDSEGLVRLGAAARRGGVTPAQLQYYCYMEVVAPAQLSASGQRLFDTRAIRRIRMVKMLNDGGYPLREIREIFMGPAADRAGSSKSSSRAKRQSAGRPDRSRSRR